MNDLVVLVVDVDAIAKVDAPLPHIASDAVAGLCESFPGNRLEGNLDALWVQEDVDAVDKVHVIARHSFGSVRMAGAQAGLTSAAAKNFTATSTRMRHSSSASCSSSISMALQARRRWASPVWPTG